MENTGILAADVNIGIKDEDSAPSLTFVGFFFIPICKADHRESGEYKAAFHICSIPDHSGFENSPFFDGLLFIPVGVFQNIDTGIFISGRECSFPP